MRHIKWNEKKGLDPFQWFIIACFAISWLTLATTMLLGSCNA